MTADIPIVLTLLMLSACAPAITPMASRATPERASAGSSAGGMDPTGRAGREGLEAGDRHIPDSDAEFFSLFTLMVPVEGVSPAQIRDTYHEARSGGRIHRATDIIVPRGTKVVAAVPGVIVRISDNSLGGKTIYQLDQVSRYLYYYAHLDSYAPDLKVGQAVNQGQLLGYVGSTGNATTPHLHFQGMRYDSDKRDYWNSNPIDVTPFFSLTGEEYR